MMEMENNRENEWLDIVKEFDQLFYADDGVFIESLMDNQLEK